MGEAVKTENLGRLFNWEQACAALGCSRSHFYNLVNSGHLPAIRTGEVKGVRVYEAECLKYLQQRAMGRA